MTAKNFLFPAKVGVLHKHMDSDGFLEPVDARIKLVQNGYELRYEDKDFVAKDLEEALGMIKSWMEMAEKEASKKPEENSEHNSEHNTSHEIS